MNNAPEGANPNLIYALYYLFKLLPVFVSGMSIYFGYRLFILGVTGQASLSLQSHMVSGQLLNAAPGLFFAVCGFAALVSSILKGVSIDFGSSEGKTKAGRTGTKRYGSFYGG